MKGMAEIAFESGGCIKFDLKAWNDEVHRALCAVSNQRSLDNFKMVAEEFFDERKEPVLTASTLLVPGYIDAEEVESSKNGHAMTSASKTVGR